MSSAIRRRISAFITYKKERGQVWNKCPPWYPTTPNEKLIPALPKDVKVGYKSIKHNSMWEKGPDARLMFLAEKMTLLFKYERIEMVTHKGEELRPYAERLIATAIRYGDLHAPTMELADFWLQVSDPWNFTMFESY
jgi:hypothetical protein